MPERILFAGFVAYFAVLLIAPLEPVVNVIPSSIAFIALSSAAFWIGSRFDTLLVIQTRTKYVSNALVRRKEFGLFYLTFAIGAFGTMVRLFDKYVVRGASGLTGFEARDALLESSASSLSLVGAALYPFGFIPIFIYLGAKTIPKSQIHFYAALLLFMIPALDALVLFSRSFMLVSLAMIYFGASITMFAGRALPARLVLPVFLGICVVGTVSVVIFSLRLDEMEFEIIDSIFQSGYGYTIKPNAFAENVFEVGGPLASILSSILPIAQYFTHSFFEFQLLWDTAETQIHSNGALHFLPYLKVLSVFGFPVEVDLWALFPRVGIFTSFYGPLWVDFGWYSIFVMFVFGMMTRRLGRLASVGDVGAYPLYCYFCVVLFFAPVVNFVISAQGMYSITAFTIFFILSRGTASYRVRKTHE